MVFNIATEVSLRYDIDIEPKIFSKQEYKQKLNLQVPFYLTIQQEAINL